MYFPSGLPRVFSSSSDGFREEHDRVLQVACSFDGRYIAVCCTHTIYLWQTFPLVRQIPYRRSANSIEQLGVNQCILWRSDRRMLAVALSKGYVQFLVVDEDEDSSSSRLFDVKFRGAPPSSGVCVLNDVFMRSFRSIGPMPTVGATPVMATPTCMTNHRQALLVATTAGVIERIPWDNPLVDSEAALALSS